MNPLSQKHPSRNRSRASGRWRPLIAILASLALVIGLVVPVSARHDSNSVNGYIEICGEDGSRMIQLGPDGEENSQCSHCGLCVISTNGTHGLIPTLSPLVLSVDLSGLKFLYLQNKTIGQSNHFRPANRGPPIRTKTIRTILPALLSNSASARNRLFDGNIPC